MEENVKRVLSVVGVRELYGRLATELIAKKDFVRAEEVLDKIIKIMPDNKVAFDHTTIPLIESYYQINKPEKADALVRIMVERSVSDMEFFQSLDGSALASADRERRMALSYLNYLANMAVSNNRKELGQEINTQMSKYVSVK